MTPAVSRVRDLTILDVGPTRLVVACDSLGGIGPKPHDTYRASAATTAHFAARVPLLELLCAGARPQVLIDNLCVELDPTGAQILDAVRKLAAEAGVPPQAVTGSTEENVATTSTGIGITAIGVPDPDSPARPGASLPGDLVVCLGLPRSAPRYDVYVGRPDLVAIADAASVIASGLVHDALPVGSHGVAWEAAQIAETAGLALTLYPTDAVDIEASGGPASCVLVTCAADDLPAVRGLMPPALPVNAIGSLTSP